jgi:hypothetical protein
MPMPKSCTPFLRRAGVTTMARVVDRRSQPLYCVPRMAASASAARRRAVVPLDYDACTSRVRRAAVRQPLEEAYARTVRLHRNPVPLDPFAHHISISQFSPYCAFSFPCSLRSLARIGFHAGLRHQVVRLFCLPSAAPRGPVSPDRRQHVVWSRHQ